MKHIHIPETNITIPRIAASFAPAGSDYTDTHNYFQCERSGRDRRGACSILRLRD